MAHVCFYVGDCDCWNVCCVAAVVKDSVFNLGVLRYIVCLCKGCAGCCVFCLYCEAWSCRCSCMGSMSGSSCICCMFVSCVHAVTVFNAAFCMTCSLLMLAEDARGDHIEGLQTTHPTSGCKLYRAFPPPAMGARFTVIWGGGKLAMRTPLDGWRCFSQKRVMSRLIQVRQHQTNESGFVISAMNKYMLGSRYP